MSETIQILLITVVVLILVFFFGKFANLAADELQAKRERINIEYKDKSLEWLMCELLNYSEPTDRRSAILNNIKLKQDQLQG